LRGRPDPSQPACLPPSVPALGLAAAGAPAAGPAQGPSPGAAARPPPGMWAGRTSPGARNESGARPRQRPPRQAPHLSRRLEPVGLATPLLLSAMW